MSTAANYTAKSDYIEISSGIIRRSSDHNQERSMAESFKKEAQPVLERIKEILESNRKRLSQSGFSLIQLDLAAQTLDITEEDADEPLKDAPTRIQFLYNGAMQPNDAFPSYQSITITIALAHPINHKMGLKLREEISEIVNLGNKLLE